MARYASRIMPTSLILVLLILIALAAVGTWLTRTATGVLADVEGLEDLSERGLDLSQPLAFNFHLHFANREVALQAAEAIASAGFQTQVSAGENLAHAIVCATKRLIATTTELSALRKQLSELARRFGGEYSHWYCDEQPVRPADSQSFPGEPM